MFRITRRSRLIAGLAITGAVALMPAAAASADAPSARALDGARQGQHHDSKKASAEQTRKAMRKLDRAATRAGLQRSEKSAGRGYFTSGGYACFYAPAWNYTICMGYTGYGTGSYQIFKWADTAGRSGYAYLASLDTFLYSIGG